MLFAHDQFRAAPQARLERWRAALSVNTAPPAEDVVERVRERVACDLDTPGALAAVDRWADQTLTRGGDDVAAPGVLARVLDALLGVRV